MSNLKNVRVQEHVGPDDFETTPRKWLEEQASALGAKYFLGYAEDGALWGRFDGGSLKLAGDVFDELRVALDANTLQQARVFGERAELFLWRAADGWHARVIQDEPGEQDYIPRKYWLWGTPHAGGNGNIMSQDGFTLFVEGAQGMRHAPPRADFKVNHHAALQVKHYVAYDAEGQAYVAMSRLVDVIRISEGGAQ